MPSTLVLDIGASHVCVGRVDASHGTAHHPHALRENRPRGAAGVPARYLPATGLSDQLERLVTETLGTGSADRLCISSNSTESGRFAARDKADVLSCARQLGMRQPLFVPPSIAAATWIGRELTDRAVMLVVDAGAQATVVSVVQLRGRAWELFAPAIAVPALGGDVLDARIVDLAAAIDPRIGHTPVTADLLTAARTVKESLSVEIAQTFRLTTDEGALDVVIPRVLLEESIGAGVTELCSALTQLMTLTDIDEVALVGGGAIVPWLADVVSTTLDRVPVIDPVPDLVVVRGTDRHQRLNPIRIPPPLPVGRWSLAIDFGTTNTVAAAVSAKGDAHLIDIEGDGSLKTPSAVLRSPDGTYMTGKAAVSQAVVHPDWFHATPKRMISQLNMLLAGQLVPTEEVIAAVLRHAAKEAIAQHDGTRPRGVVLTHPAGWVGPRLELLRSAADIAGLSDVRLVPEPVAAASWIGAEVIEAGMHIAVYDFGGGTFDVAVVTRTSTGFEVSGDPGGVDPLGGEVIDDAIIDYLGRTQIGERAEWQELMQSQEPHWTRRRAELRRNVRDAKEALAGSSEYPLWIPALECDHTLTRGELDAIVEPWIQQTIDELVMAIEAAGLRPDQIAGIYLTGGSSRLVRVAEMVEDQLQQLPHRFLDPKAVVAIGGTTFTPAFPTHPAIVGPTLAVDLLGRRDDRVDYSVTVKGSDAVVSAQPNRWPFVGAYAGSRHNLAAWPGWSIDPPTYGEALGAPGALLVTAHCEDGRDAALTYQLTGRWAINTVASGRVTAPTKIRVVDDPAWPADRPPFDLAGCDGTPVVEDVVLSVSRSGITSAASVTARSESLAASDLPTWAERYVRDLAIDRTGLALLRNEPATFLVGQPCQLVKLGGQGRNVWIWFGIVGNRGLSVVIDCSGRMSDGAARRLRDRIRVYR